VTGVMRSPGRSRGAAANDACTQHLRAAGPARLRSDLNFTEAIQTLRGFTLSPAERGLFSLLIRAAVLSPAAAEVLVRMDLRTKAQRRAAVVAATVAMAAEIDAGEAQ
jgi:hypothetical protein